MKKQYDLKVETTFAIKIEDIADIICIAFEGWCSGTYSWADIVGYVKPKGKVTFRILEDKELYKAIDYPMTEGGAVKLKDREEGKTYSLTYKKVLKGLKIVAAKYPRIFMRIISQEYDTIDADAVIQAALLGDFLYDM